MALWIKLSNLFSDVNLFLKICGEFIFFALEIAFTGSVANIY